jgi:excisionase family DNA binding protein
MAIQITLSKEQVEQILNDNKQNSSIEPETFSITKAAEKLGISKSTIHKMIKNGEISKIMLGKSARITRKEIESLLYR